MNDLIPLPLPERNDVELTFETIRQPFWKTFAAPAGALALVLAIGWTVAARIDDATSAPSADQVAAQNAAQVAADSAAEALRTAQAQHQEIAALRGHVENLRSKLEVQAQKTHASETTIAALQKTLAEQKADTAAAESQLQAKIEKVRSEAEKALDKTPVASIAKPLPTSLPGAKPPQAILKPPQANLKPPQAKPVAAQPPLGPYRAFVLREVEGGRAVVEGMQGLEEVGPGDTLPGGARVEKIEKRGQRWMVMTDRGYIAPDGRWDD